MRLFLSPGVALCAVVVSATSAIAQSWPKLQVELVQGFGAASNLQRAEYTDALKVAFAGHAVTVNSSREQTDPKVLDRAAAIQSIQKAGVWFFSGHSGPVQLEADKPPMQLLQVRGENGERAFLTAPDITAALRGRTGPRLVIVNGCETTNPADGVADEYRLSTAFGIDVTSTGRAYLGWPTPINPLNSDVRIGKLLEVWTRFSEELGDFPTLRQAVDIASRATDAPGLKNLRDIRIIGDDGLRYCHPYTLAPRLPGEKLGKGTAERVFWFRTGPTTGKLILDMGTSAESQKMLAVFGLTRFITFEGKQEEDSESFECRSKLYEEFIAKGFKMAMEGMDRQMGSNKKRRVEATDSRILVRPEGSDFLLDWSFELAVFTTRPDRPGEERENKRSGTKMIARPMKGRTSLTAADR